MTRRALVLAAVLAAVIVLAAAPGWAVPSCREAGTLSMCNSACYFAAKGSCISVSVSPDCRFLYNCQGGPISGDCVCSEQPPAGGGCFLAGTRITMADGATKAIEDIAVGDVVLAYDKASGTMKPDPVKHLHAPFTADSYLVVNERLHITPTQPVFSAGRWIEMGQLAVGDTLTATDGSAVPIESIVTVKGPITVYNFDVNPYETFVAEGFIVHRKQETQEP